MQLCQSSALFISKSTCKNLAEDIYARKTFMNCLNNNGKSLDGVIMCFHWFTLDLPKQQNNNLQTNDPTGKVLTSNKRL